MRSHDRSQVKLYSRPRGHALMSECHVREIWHNENKYENFNICLPILARFPFPIAGLKLKFFRIFNFHCLSTLVRYDRCTSLERIAGV